jgi:hypothetical protein
MLQASRAELAGELLGFQLVRHLAELVEVDAAFEAEGVRLDAKSDSPPVRLDVKAGAKRLIDDVFQGRFP